MGRQITITTPWGASHDVTVPDGASDQDIASYIDKVGPDMAKADGAKGAFMFDQNGQNKRWVDAAHMPDAQKNGWQTSQPTQFEQQRPQLPEHLGFTPGNMARQAVQGVKELGKGAVQMADDVGGALLPQAAGGDSFANNKLQQDLQGPMDADAEKSRQAFKNGHTAQGIGYAITSGIPVVGSLMSNIAEQAGRGDVGGATAKTAAQVAVPELAGKAAPIVKGLAKEGARAAIDSVAPGSVGELTGTAPERITSLKSFPDKVEGIRQTVVNAEQQAHATAKAAFPQFEKPITLKEAVPEHFESGKGWVEGQPGEVTSWKQLQEDRSTLLKQIADEKQAVQAGAAPRFDLAKMYEKLHDIDGTMSKAALDQGGPEGVAKLEQARQQYKAYMDDFHNPGAPLRSYLDAKPMQTDAVVNRLLKPDAARDLETLRKNGVNTQPIEQMLQNGDRPVRVDNTESSKLRKAGSDEGYTRQRLNESLNELNTQQMPPRSQATLPKNAKDSEYPTVVGKGLKQVGITPKAVTRIRIERALRKLDGK